MTAQLPLFKPPKAHPRAKRLGTNQQAVLARIDRYGCVRVREAGRIVFLNRGHRDPTRVPREYLESAGLRVLISLRKHGLVRSRRDGVWMRQKRAAA